MTWASKWCAAACLAGALVSMTGCGGPPARAETPPDPVEVTWDRLSRELERAPIWTSSLHWRGIYDEMLRIGLERSEARFLIRRTAKYGPSRYEVEALLDREHDPDRVIDVLDDRYAELTGRDPRHPFRDGNYSARVKVEGDGYDHERPRSEEARYRAKLQTKLEAPPIYGSALNWLPVYKDMIRLGFSPKEAYGLCLRSAHHGPARRDIEALIDASKGDQAKFKLELDDAYNSSRDGLEHFVERGGHFRGKEKTWEERKEQSTIVGGKEEEGAEPAPAPAEDLPPAEAMPEFPPAGADEFGEFSEPAEEGVDDLPPPAEEGGDELPPAEEGVDDLPPPAEGGMEDPPADDPPLPGE